MDYLEPIKQRTEALAKMSPWVRQQNRAWQDEQMHTWLSQSDRAYFDEYVGAWISPGRPARKSGAAPVVQEMLARFTENQLQDSKLPLNCAQREFWSQQHDASRIGEIARSPDGKIHRVGEYKENGSPIVTFRWHWDRGTFDARMSAVEIATFIMPHMPHILPLLGHWPDCHRDFGLLLKRLLLWPMQVLDEVLPWIRRLEYTETDEILLLDLGAVELPTAPNHFVMSGSGVYIPRTFTT